ncbi:hypothetical protein BDW59DRAFT_171376 [Aspergillus cavernicola]|uniref:tyrosinase n=1 Tax=Aspergillus cavernicola TaxID=176166 RepID=A0ABR4IKC7_9EURO
MSDTFYPITGIPIPDGETTPARLSLFIRALRKMQDRSPVNDPFSYYQLAGIHGFPTVSWDNANVLDGFYCTHGVFTFPPWHRPYMLLYEQVIYSIMVEELIPSIPDEAAKKGWKNAAQRWRLPFWDWAVPQSDTGEYGVPQIVELEQVEVVKLGRNDKEPVQNPLYKFTNKVNGEEVSVDDPRMGAQRLRYTDNFNKCIGTSRYGDPDMDSWVHGSLDNAKVKDALEHPKGKHWETGVSIADNVYRILTTDYFKSYEAEYLSLEMIHNNIHNWTGGAEPHAMGHMSDVPVASFDPIFWLHHCNVDRLLTIWQYLNPDKWFNNPLPDHGHDSDGNPLPGPPYSPDPKSTDDLPPFHINKEGKYYSSDSARYTERLGYTYPDLLKPNVDHLEADLKNKYGKHISKLKAPVDDKKNLVPGIGVDIFPDYVINVEYDRFALGGEPYTVNFYLDTYNNQSKSSERCALGSFYNFTAPVVPDCKNCKAQKDRGVKSKAQVPITLPLQGLVRSPNYTDANSMERFHVEILLEQQLQFSVTKRSGEEIPPKKVPGLLVTVQAGEARYPRDDSLDVFKPQTYKPLWKATQYKACGAAPG